MLNILRSRPHLWFQLYWVVYLVWFFTLDWTITDPAYIIHSPLDDLIPFCEWFIFPYCSWFLLLAGVTGLLWWFDTASYDKLCLTMFSGMTFCLILYMILPNGVDLRPTAAEVGRDNVAMDLMQLIWMADAFSYSRMLARYAAISSGLRCLQTCSSISFSSVKRANCSSRISRRSMGAT